MVVLVPGYALVRFGRNFGFYLQRSRWTFVKKCQLDQIDSASLKNFWLTLVVVQKRFLVFEPHF